MKNVAQIVPGWSAFFLAIMAMLIKSPALFFMATAMIATLMASRLQAYLSVRYLRIERVSPPAVNLGEHVTVDLIVWSERRMKRPLITIKDDLPKGLKVADLTPSMPIAPSFEQPIHTRYGFRPLRRGHFKWQTLTLIGTDALGLVSASKRYKTELAELIVYPVPLPVSVPIAPSGGHRRSETETGKYRGSGIEPRGVREYQSGDPQRYVHWASSARSNRLMVKEFEAGSGLSAIFILQRTIGSEFGRGEITNLEAMCGHALFMSAQFLKQNATVTFPMLERSVHPAQSYELRMREISEMLAYVQADQRSTLSQELAAASTQMQSGGTLYLMLALKDEELPATLRSLGGYERVCLIYDGSTYVGKDSPQGAADPSYLDQLRQAGAHVFVMPHVRGLT